MKVLVLGASGMLGNAMIRRFAQADTYEVFGTVRSTQHTDHFSTTLRKNLISGVDVESQDSLVRVFARVKPDVVINCVGLVKQLSDVNDPLVAVPLNTLLPHRLAQLCNLVGSRLIHVSTDCVFSGEKGAYLESDLADARDVYGRSKLMGEVDYPHCVTLRTSIIGQELSGHRSLVGWFLSQTGPISGYRRAIFSGLPTVELASVVLNSVLPNKGLIGLYHVAAEPISKFDLLSLIGEVYGHRIEIRADDSFQIDRSLNAKRFNDLTGYKPPAWRELVSRMFAFR